MNTTLQLHDATMRLLGAQEAAKRVLYSESGIPKSWPVAAMAHRNALQELFDAVGEVLHVEWCPINPDVAEEGWDLHATLGLKEG